MQPHTCAMPRAGRSRACHQGCARARRERARPPRQLNACAAIPTPRITPTADAARATQTLGRTGTVASELGPDVDTEWGSCCELALDASVAVALDEAGPPPPPVLGYFAEDELTRLAPSGAIEIEEGERVRVCKDVAVKVRVMRSVLRLVGDRTLESDLRPICGGGKAEAEEWTLVDRCRRLFAAIQSDTSKGMSAAHYVRFCKNAGLLELGAFAKADLEIMHTQLCASRSGARTSRPKN